MIAELIDKQDNFEVVRDQIAAILTLEIANQMVLADAAGKDPNEWDLKIFSERSNPWEKYLNAAECADVANPIVNVWYDTSNFDQKSSDVVQRQTSKSVFNIDCYGYGRSSDNQAGGHNAGDKSAALAAHKAVRLVRNILMAGEYAYLDLRGVVGMRWPQSINVFQPQIDSRTVEQVIGARIALSVSFNEFSPQVIGEDLELISTNVTRQDDGEIVINADYEYPL